MADLRGVPTPHGGRPAVRLPSAAATNPDVQESPLSTGRSYVGVASASSETVVTLQARVRALEEEVGRLSRLLARHGLQSNRRSTPYPVAVSLLSNHSSHPRNLGA